MIKTLPRRLIFKSIRVGIHGEGRESGIRWLTIHIGA